MARNLFSVPIFFIVFRETLEGAIVIAVLLGLVEQLVLGDQSRSSSATHVGQISSIQQTQEDDRHSLHTRAPWYKRIISSNSASRDDVEVEKRRLIRNLRMQIVIGSVIGLLVALALGGTFIAVWFTQASNLWAKSEALWEGIFSLIASLLILVMGVTMLKLDGKKVKWRIKMMQAFEEKGLARTTDSAANEEDMKQIKAGRWALMVLPLITVLREGLEAVVFVGGVSLGQPASAIPIATICGIFVGLICGWLIYSFGSRTTLTTFMIVMTNFILLIGAGLFSKAVFAFQENAFNHLLGADVDDAGGSGPGSYDVRGNVWHLDCCNPEDTTGAESQGWLIFGAIFGWTNSATIGSVLSYIFYWLAVIVILLWLKWREGRMSFFGRRSARGLEREEKKRSRLTSAVKVSNESSRSVEQVKPYDDDKELSEREEVPEYAPARGTDILIDVDNNDAASDNTQVKDGSEGGDGNMHQDRGALDRIEELSIMRSSPLGASGPVFGK